MAKSEDSYISYSGKSIAKNTMYNLLGYGIPLLVAIVIIPVLIKGLGDERFGILILAWIVIGYFSFFDFGIGRGLTKVISEKIGSNRKEEIPDIFWTSFFLMLAISSFVAIVLILIMPSIVGIFNISSNMQSEALMTFYALAVSIPIVSTTAGLRGVLEAYQKFGSINKIRVFLGIFTFLGPLLVLFIINSLFWIVIVMIFIRVLVWILYLLQCFKINDSIKNKVVFKFSAIKPVLRFSMWITIANIVGPIIVYSDRILIGALISAAAITYYATPYEIVTKLLLIPGALTGVLFPVFSASFFSNPDISIKILLKGIKVIFLTIYPVVLLIVIFSTEGMRLWLGEEFAVNSSLILQFLSIGVLMNCLSSIPNNFFQGTGKPYIPAIIMLVELPFYLLTMWFAIDISGIKGAALTYMLAATVNTVIMYLVANKLFALRFTSKFNAFLFLFMIIGLIFPFLISNIYVRMIYAFVFILVFMNVTWKHFLSSEEKLFIASKLKMYLNYRV